MYKYEIIIGVVIISLFLKVFYDIFSLMGYYLFSPKCHSCGLKYNSYDKSLHRLWRHNLCIVNEQ